MPGTSTPPGDEIVQPSATEPRVIARVLVRAPDRSVINFDTTQADDRPFAEVRADSPGVRHIRPRQSAANTAAATSSGWVISAMCPPGTETGSTPARRAKVTPGSGSPPTVSSSAKM